MLRVLLAIVFTYVTSLVATRPGGQRYIDIYTGNKYVGIILKWILSKLGGRTATKFMWLEKMTNGRLL